MTVESAVYLSQLVPANPDQGSPVSNGDDHLRLIKDTLQNTLKSASVLYMLKPEVTTGVGDAYVINTDPVTTALPTGSVLKFTADRNSTGPATLSIDGVGPIPMYKGELPVDAGDIVAGQMYTAVYDGGVIQVRVETKIQGVPVVTLKEVTDNGLAVADMTVDWTLSNMQEIQSVDGQAVVLAFTDPVGPAKLLLYFRGAAGAPMAVTLPVNVVVLNDTWEIGGGTGDDILELVFDGDYYAARVYEDYS